MTTTEPDASFIPLVDLSSWFDGTDDDRIALAREVDGHLRRCGFLVVINHGIDHRVFDDLRRECRAFFHLPEAEKSALAPSDGLYRGWIGAGKESNAATYGIETPPDLKETFAYGTIDVPDESLRNRFPFSYAPNAWPDNSPTFRPAAEVFWRAGRTLADEILRLFALALDLDAEAITNQCTATTATGTLNWYWPYDRSGEPAPEQFRIGPHTDFGTVTILDRQPGVGGLQVRDDDHNWIDAPVLEGSLIVNTGDMLRQWTNDRWCSNEHRVLPPSAQAADEELISLVFFHEPDADAVIEPFPTCVSADNPARYEPILAMDYLAEKFAALSVD